MSLLSQLRSEREPDLAKLQAERDPLPEETRADERFRDALTSLTGAALHAEALAVAIESNDREAMARALAAYRRWQR